MSYGPNFLNLFQCSADYVDKILRGAKPADIPVQQPTKLELVISLRSSSEFPGVIAHADPGSAPTAYPRSFARRRAAPGVNSPGFPRGVSGFSMIRNRLEVPYYDMKLGRLSNGPRNDAWEVECKLLWLKRKGTRGWKSRRS